MTKNRAMQPAEEPAAETPAAPVAPKRKRATKKDVAEAPTTPKTPRKKKESTNTNANTTTVTAETADKPTKRKPPAKKRKESATSEPTDTNPPPTIVVTLAPQEAASPKGDEVAITVVETTETVRVSQPQPDQTREPIQEQAGTTHLDPSVVTIAPAVEPPIVEEDPVDDQARVKIIDQDGDQHSSMLMHDDTTATIMSQIEDFVGVQDMQCSVMTMELDQDQGQIPAVDVVEYLDETTEATNMDLMENPSKNDGGAVEDRGNHYDDHRTKHVWTSEEDGTLRHLLEQTIVGDSGKQDEVIWPMLAVAFNGLFGRSPAELKDRWESLCQGRGQ
ncbi:hypothetical protein HKX48_008701 [Thoreauomyces humboldtii]|nr:hypothetical protein HKX48_008701 [Thoreauomyces humboldtii]